PDAIIVGMEADEEIGDYVLNYLQFSGNSNDFLTGDGTWVDGAGTACDWDVLGGGNDLATGYPGACAQGNVAIGDVAPAAKLDVTLTNANASENPFESTAIFAFNRFASPFESGIINRGIRSWSIMPNEGEGAPEFYGTNMGGNFWASAAEVNVGLS